MQLFQVNAEIYDEDSMLGRETSYLTADNAVKAAYYARGMLRNICLECSLNLEELIRDHWSIFYKLEWPDKEIIYGYSVEVVSMDSQNIDCSRCIIKILKQIRLCRDMKFCIMRAEVR